MSLLLAAIQSLGETQIDLGAAIVPPPTTSMMERPRGDSRSPLVGQEGDINDTVIDNIVEEDSSVEDDEEGEIMILQSANTCTCMYTCFCVMCSPQDTL